MRFFYLPGWLWLVLMVLFLVIGVATGDPAALAAVGLSVGLALVIALIGKAFDDRDSPHKRFSKDKGSEQTRAKHPGETPVMPEFNDAASARPKQPAASRVLGAARTQEPAPSVAEMHCSACGEVGQFIAPPSTFYGACPNCGHKMYIGP